MKNKIHEIEVCRTGIGFATIKIETDIPIAKCIQDKDTIIERDDLYVELEYHATILG
jgi:hypothetical protein